MVFMAITYRVRCDCNHVGLDFHRAWAGYLTQSRVGISPTRGRYLTQLRVGISPTRRLLSRPLAGHLTQSWVVISPSRGSESHFFGAHFIADSTCTRNIFRARCCTRAASLFRPRTLLTNCTRQPIWACSGHLHSGVLSFIRASDKIPPA